MANIDVRLLRYFIAVAETGHMTRAAERLGIGQPPLSQQIRVLETQLGVTLFERLPRGMALTDAGQAFLADAYEVVRKLDQAVDDVRRVAAGVKGRLSVGFTSSAALHPFVPTVIRAFRADQPQVMGFGAAFLFRPHHRLGDHGAIGAAFHRPVACPRVLRPDEA